MVAPMTQGSSVTSCHLDWHQNSPLWYRTDCVLAGSDAVKSEAHLFLPRSQYDIQHPDHFASYVQRANFVNFTARTLSALVGLIYRKDPSVKVPSQYKKRLENINNSGDDFITFSKKVTECVIKHGRAGILVDYASGNPIDDPLSTYPYLQLYNAHSITNWRVRAVGGYPVLDQVVLRWTTEEFQEFGVAHRVRYGVLDLDSEGFYRCRHFDQMDGGGFFEGPAIYPGRQGGGAGGLRKIPFTFINPVDLSHNVYRSPILDLVDLNLSHFRTSADYEHALWLTAQPTAIITGMSSEDSSVFRVGGSQVWKLPENADAKYLEMTAEGIAGTERALQAKEAQMREIGMQMLSSSSNGPETAAAARIRQHSQTSVLSSIAGTVSSGLQAALKTACAWDGISGDCNVELNQDFMDATIEPQMLHQLTMMVDHGLIPRSDYIWNLIRGELIQPGKTIQEIVDELETQPPITLGTPDMTIAQRVQAKPEPEPKKEPETKPAKKEKTDDPAQ